MLQPIASLARIAAKFGVALLALLTLAAGSMAPQRQTQAAPALQPTVISFQQIADVASVQGSQPVAIANAGDGSGRLFIVEQPGRIRIYNGSQLLATPFLNITNIVNSNGSEQGLLGLAFDPDFADNGYFYVNYTGKNGVGDTVIARYHVSDATPNDADEGSALPLLTIAQPQSNHNGGALQFGPDGFLYISTGDGGGGGDNDVGHNPTIGNAQDLNSLLGKMLRIDVHNNNTGDGLAYDIPPGNPFANDGNPNTRAEIWAYGLRNPWRFSFDRQTGDMFIGDVGQDAWEEIDFQPAGVGGRNYGWRRMEGDQCFNPSSGCQTGSLILPILNYENPDNSCRAVSGGYRYRGGSYPQFAGVYFYADNCSGEVWGATQSGADWTEGDPIDTAFAITTFGEDEAGELYLADHGGKIYRIIGNSEFVYLPSVRR
jgi:glucose/arabinose dehydrogenase